MKAIYTVSKTDFNYLEEEINKAIQSRERYVSRHINLSTTRSSSTIPRVRKCTKENDKDKISKNLCKRVLRVHQSKESSSVDNGSSRRPVEIIPENNDEKMSNIHVSFNFSCTENIT